MVEMLVDDAMTKKPITCGKDEKITKVAKEMEKNDIGSMIVADKDTLIGLITSEDLIKRVIIQKKDPEKTTAKDVMTKKLLTTTPDEELSEAIYTMINNGIKRLPVIEDKKLVGILTDGDVMRISPKLMEGFLASEEREEPNVIGDVCELCGNYSETLNKVNGRWICEECLETSPEI